MSKTTKEYLGDSVYAEMESGMIRLTTENGFGASNEIFLETYVFHNLKRYADAHAVKFRIDENEPTS
jgi:ABC-type proline/glycine betaine transport system substrate-binding protein